MHMQNLDVLDCLGDCNVKATHLIHPNQSNARRSSVTNAAKDHGAIPAAKRIPNETDLTQQDMDMDECEGCEGCEGGNLISPTSTSSLMDFVSWTESSFQFAIWRFRFLFATSTDFFQILSILSNFIGLEVEVISISLSSALAA